MSHFVVKLVSGELLYGTIDETKKEKSMIVLDNPLTWQEYDEEGLTGSALVKFINGTDESQIPIAISSIVSMAKMSPAFEEFYEAAVAVQQITTAAYEENLAYMTTRMIDLVMEYQDKMQARETDELVISSKRSSNTTIH